MRVDVELRAVAMDLPSSSEKVVPSCARCFRLLHKPNERRVLHSPSTSNVWRVLRQLTEDIFSGNVDKNFHMEHLNRECKQGISGLGANSTDVSIQRIGKCIGRIYSTLLQYDTVNAVKQESGHPPYLPLY